MGVPAAQTSAALVFNRALLRLLDQPEPRTGMSWKEYVAWAARVTRASGNRVAGTMDASGDYRALWLWLRGQGSEMYRGRQLGFSSAELLDWFEFWEVARFSRATPSAALVEQADSGELARQLVVTGHTAASFAWSHQLPELQRLTMTASWRRWPSRARPPPSGPGRRCTGPPSRAPATRRWW